MKQNQKSVNKNFIHNQLEIQTTCTNSQKISSIQAMLSPNTLKRFKLKRTMLFDSENVSVKKIRSKFSKFQKNEVNQVYIKPSKLSNSIISRRQKSENILQPQSEENLSKSRMEKEKKQEKNLFPASEKFFLQKNRRSCQSFYVNSHANKINKCNEDTLSTLLHSNLSFQQEECDHEQCKSKYKKVQDEKFLLGKLNKQLSAKIKILEQSIQSKSLQITSLTDEIKKIQKCLQDTTLEHETLKKNIRDIYFKEMSSSEIQIGILKLKQEMTRLNQQNKYLKQENRKLKRPRKNQMHKGVNTYQIAIDPNNNIQKIAQKLKNQLCQSIKITNRLRIKLNHFLKGEHDIRKYEMEQKNKEIIKLKYNNKNLLFECQYLKRQNAHILRNYYNQQINDLQLSPEK